MSDYSSAFQALTGHRFYKYRGCAPSPDTPGMSLGDDTVPLDAWSAPTEDGGEPQKQRIARERAAVAVCGRCPVLAECRTYALSETPEGKLAEPDGIHGGLLSLERHRALIHRRQAEAGTRPAPTVDVGQVRTVQKQRLLASLARETDEELVAYRAGMDVRTANWHRSLLCGLLGMDKETATRQQLLDAARTLGLLPKGTRVKPDGRWPIPAAPDTTGARQRRISAGMPIQLTLPGYQHLPRGRRRRPGPPRGEAAAGPSRRGPRLRIVRLAEAVPLFPITLPATSELEPAA